MTKKERRKERRKVTPRITSEVLAFSNFKCFYCQAEFGQENQPTLDHIVPIYKGGKTELKNLVAACAKCNSYKGHKEIVEHFGGKKPFEDAVKVYLGLNDFEVNVLRIIRKIKNFIHRVKRRNRVRINTMDTICDYNDCKNKSYRA